MPSFLVLPDSLPQEEITRPETDGFVVVSPALFAVGKAYRPFTSGTAFYNFLQTSQTLPHVKCKPRNATSGARQLFEVRLYMVA